MQLFTNELLKCFRQYKLLGVLGICLVFIFLAGNAVGSSNHATAANLITEWTWGLPSGLFLPILIAMVCTDLVSSEVVKGTVKMILIRPVSRWSIWLSKWITGVVLSWLILLFLAGGLYVFVGLMNGFGSWSAPAYVDSKMLDVNAGVFTLQAYGLQLLNVAGMVTFMLALSTFIDNSTFTFGITMIAIIGTFLLLLMVQPMEWEKFLFSIQWWLLPEYLSGTQVISSGLFLSFGVELGWMVVFSGVGIARFQFRDFAS